LLGIINDILDLSKIEAGRFDIDIEQFDPTLVVEDVRSVMDIRASEKGLKLEVEYISDMPRVIESDSKRLKQILINLVGNAIKFTNKGSVRIVVSFSRAAHVDDGRPRTCGGQLIIDINDTGIGMTPEQQERLFKPFSQGDSLITQQFGGTGLGLAISQRLATMLNGEIRVDSTVEHGSTFTLAIATGDAEDTALIQPLERPASHREAPMTTELPRGAQILIVDDRRDIRFLSNRIVTMAGGQVTEAEDGVQAIETVRRAASQGVFFDIILLDMQMPNMDGYATATALRELGFTNPIIAVTADAMQGDMSKCIAAGCNYHISKPINKFELLQMLHATLGPA
jgi:CheY-like chemotaxis protein